jgi:hypothetical protein
VSLSMIETAVDAVKGYLEANIEGYVNAVNAQYTDGIVIAPFAYYFIAERPQFGPAETPACFILGEDTSLDGDTGMDWFAESHDLTLILADGDADTDVVRRRLYRLTLATVNALVAGIKTQGALSVQLHPASRNFVRYSPIYRTNTAGAFMQGCALRFTANLGEPT